MSRARFFACLVAVAATGSLLACSGGAPECTGVQCLDASSAGGGAADGGDDDEDSGSDEEDAGDDEPDAGREPCEGPPGLYQDEYCSVISAGLIAMRPAYVLWTDAADKDRYLSVPAGTQIDTSDADSWVFPVGTRMWKTFSIGGHRIETRVMEKTTEGVGASHWTFSVYQWSEDQLSVTDVSDAEFGVSNAYMDHDIPSRAQCLECHAAGTDNEGGARDPLLGVSALQLAHNFGGADLDALDQAGLLTHAIAEATARPPGDSLTQAAIGYLHANCGHCHRGTDPAGGMVLWHDVGYVGTAAASPVYADIVGIGTETYRVADGLLRVNPANPGASAILERMLARGTMAQMPPLGTEFPDRETGVADVTAWVESLQQ